MSSAATPLSGGKWRGHETTCWGRSALRLTSFAQDKKRHLRACVHLQKPGKYDLVRVSLSLEHTSRELCAPLHAYAGIRSPLHPRSLRSAPCDVLREYASVARLASPAHRHSRCIAICMERDTGVGPKQHLGACVHLQKPGKYDLVRVSLSLEHTSREPGIGPKRHWEHACISGSYENVARAGVAQYRTHCLGTAGSV
jgi:hypothetical protein